MIFDKMLGDKIEYCTNIPLICNGGSNYKIIYAKNATETEKFAARELSDYLEKITDVKIPVCEEDEFYTKKSKIISIGKTEFLKKSGLKYSGIDFNIDGFVIKTYGNSLFMFGGVSQRGTLYAVYEYLESCLGCKFLTPECEFVPKRDIIYLPKLSVADIPAFGIREVVYDTVSDDAFSAKARLFAFDNSKEENIYGETIKTYIWSQCHNVTREIVSYEQYGEKHPEWFYKANNGVINFIFSHGLTIDGKYDENLLENPIDVAVESLKAAIQNTHAYYFQVSQCDVDTLCEEKNYREMAKKYTDSGVMLLFLNNVCERLDRWIETATDETGKKLFPNGRDYKIITFAYSYTQFPPITENGKLLINLNKKIFVWIAPIEFNCLLPYNSFIQMHYVTKLIPDWTKLTKNVGIWDYYSNFSSTSMYYSPYLSTAVENYKFYKKCGIKDYILSEFSGYVKGPRNAFDELKTYVASKLMWDPYRRDVSEIVKEYCCYYYGRYGEIAVTVIDNMEKQIKKLTSCSRNYAMCHTALNWAQFFPLELLKENEKIVESALKDNEKYKKEKDYEILKTRLKQLKLLFIFNQAYEYDTYYPRSTKPFKKRFYEKYFELLQETSWNDFIGKTSDYFIENERERFGFNYGEGRI